MCSLLIINHLPYWSLLIWENNADGLAPKVINKKLTYIFYLGDSGAYEIVCNAEGNPQPEVNWTRLTVPVKRMLTLVNYICRYNFKLLSQLNRSADLQNLVRIQHKKLMFSAITSDIAGDYVCTALNEKHNLSDSKTFTVAVKGEARTKMIAEAIWNFG